MWSDRPPGPGLVSAPKMDRSDDPGRSGGQGPGAVRSPSSEHSRTRPRRAHEHEVDAPIEQADGIAQVPGRARTRRAAGASPEAVDASVAANGVLPARREDRPAGCPASGADV